MHNPTIVVKNLCTNSMIVFIFVVPGSNSLLHLGQLSPHPAPDPVICTMSPLTITKIVSENTNQAKMR